MTSNQTPWQHQGRRPVIAVTCGEPAGIGPEISLRGCWQLRNEICPVLIGDARQLLALAALIDPAIRLHVIGVDDFLASTWPQQSVLSPPDVMTVVDVSCPMPVRPGQLDAGNGLAVLRMLDVAIAAAVSRQVGAITTAPLQKSTINDAGVAFSGHTEYLAEKTGTPQVVMMLATDRTSPPLRVALATTHLPLQKVSAALTIESLLTTLRIIDHDMRQKFGIASPRILVTGLNPHAGENGYLGREEIDVIQPALQQAQAQQIDARGPYPADTLFQPRYLQDADCVLAMFHDQGLPVLKYAGFGAGINITLGLPIIRTSVDHGTALDLAQRGIGHADSGSMLEALRAAAAMTMAATG